jgi:hypothetical protein
MFSLIHLFVIPITGADRGRICLVCKAQSSPAVVAFIKPQEGVALADMADAMELLDAIDLLKRDDEPLRKYVVFKTEASLVTHPDGKVTEEFSEEFKSEVTALAKARRLKFPLAALPSGGLPDTLPSEITRNTENAVMFYRHRQTDDDLLFSNVSFRDRGPEDLMETSRTFLKLQEAANKL